MPTPIERFLSDRSEAGKEYRQKAKEAGQQLKQTTASKVLRGAISGPLKAINETVETVDDVADYFRGNPYDNNDLIDLQSIGLEVEGDKEDWKYTVPQAVTQFLLPMGLVGGGLRKVITNPWARGAVAGFVTDAVVQDPYEENLFNMLDKHPRFASPVTEILKAKTEEEIGVAEARLRQATGGTLTGEVATGVVLGVRALKKAPKAVQERILKRLFNDENTRLVYAASDDIDNLGDEIIDEFSVTTGRQKILPGTPHPTDAKKVRGYEGRWVTKKHFDQVTESRKGANEIRAQFDQPVQEVAELSQEKAIDLRLLNEGKIDTYIDGPVYIDRIERDIDGQWVTSSGLRGDYDLTIKNPEDLEKIELKEFGFTKKEFSKLSTQKKINLLKKSFDKTRKSLPEGTYQLYGTDETRRSLYARWFKNDPDIEWFDIKTDQPAKPSKDSYAVLTVKEPTFEEWVKNPSEEYKALFKEIEETSKSAKENIARSKQLFKEIKSGLDEQDRLLKEGSQYDQLSPTDQKKVDLEMSLRGDTPPKKISERLRENLKNVAESDARALRETDELLKEVSEITGSKQLPDSPRIGTQIPRGETAQSGAVFIERVDKGTGQTGPIQKAFNLPNTYDLAVLELQELNATQLAELGIKKADIAKLTPRKTINLLKKNFDNVRKDLLPGEYRMEGYSESRRKLYKKWFKDDSDVVWVDRQTGAASTIDDEMSIPYLTVKDQPVDVGGGGALDNFTQTIKNAGKDSQTPAASYGGIVVEWAEDGSEKAFHLQHLDLLKDSELTEIGLTRSQVEKLTAKQKLTILKDNFNTVKKALPPGEYTLDAIDPRLQKQVRSFLKNDPDISFSKDGEGLLTISGDVGGGGAVPPRKPPAGSGADVPPADPTDPKVQTTFNPKFLPDLDVEKLILDEAEKVKNLDASGQWPYRRTFKDMVNNANQLLPKEVIEQARLFNARYGRGGESDLPATLIAMNQQMNKNATALYDLSKAMDMALSTGNKEGFAELKEQLIRETKVLDGLITLNKPLKTVPAQTLAANKAGGGIADKVAKVEDLASRTPAEKAIDQAVDVRGVVDEGGEEAIEQETLRQIIEAAEQGDKPAMKKLRTITKRLQAASGNPEALRRMAQEGPIIKGLRVSNEIFINSILSGPETHAVNILSTALNTVARPLEQIVGSAVTGNTQGMMRGAKELMYLTQSIGDSLKMAKAAFRIEDNIINPGAMIQDASRFNVRMDGEGTLANIINTFGTIQRLPSRFLLAEDEFFKSMNFRAYLKASAWENGVNKGLDGQALKDYIQDQFDKTIGIVNEGSMKNTKSIEIADLYEKAQQYAAETTFTADLPAGSFGKKIQGVASHPAGRVIFPFVRTPINIFKAQVRRTPGVNLILQEYRQALRSSDPSVAARARGEMVIGGAVWSVAGIAAYAINDDFSELAITGGGPSNYDLLNQKKSTGWQPYSFRFLKKDENGQPIIGQDGRPKYKYVSFKRLDPWSSFLMMAADSAAITGQLSQQDRDDFGVAASVALGRNITNKTYLQGITELTDLLQKPYKLESWLARRAAATLNPFSSLGRSADKYWDPTIMDKRVRPGDEGMVFLRRFHNELAATIPGYGAGMKPIQNFITGSLVEYPVGHGPEIMKLPFTMNPFKETNSLNNSVLTTLVDIGAKIEKPKDVLSGGIKLNSDQYSDLVNDIAFVKIGGQRMVHALHKTMQRKDIKALLATARGEKITAANQDISVAAQEEARADAEQIFRQIINAYKKAGREQWIRKPENRELALKYDAEINAINEARSNSVLDNFKQLQGATN